MFPTQMWKFTQDAKWHANDIVCDECIVSEIFAINKVLGLGCSLKTEHLSSSIRTWVQFPAPSSQLSMSDKKIIRKKLIVAEDDVLSI